MLKNKIFPLYYKDEKLEDYPSLPTIYCFVNMINQKFYVGQTDNLQRRLMQHLRDLRANRDYCSLLQRAWNKYGEDNFKIEIVEFCKVYELDEKEELHIKEKQSMSFQNGYNLFGGGRTQRGEFHPLKGKKYTKEELSNRPPSKKGKDSPLYGIKRSPETTKKMSDSTKGRKMTPEWIEKSRVSRTGRPLSQEHRKNISIAKKGKKNTEEAKFKIKIGNIGLKKFSSSSIFPGVSFDKSSKNKKWVAQLEVDTKNIKIGRFASEEDAFVAYKNKVEEIYGKEILKKFEKYESILKELNEKRLAEKRENDGQ